MPLRPDNKRKFNNSDEDRAKNNSFDSCYDTMDDGKTEQETNCSGDEEDPDEFLSQMGLETEEIKKINNAQVIYLIKLKMTRNSPEWLGQFY